MLRRIDVTTLRENPDAGKTSFRIPVGCEVTIRGDPWICRRVLGDETFMNLFEASRRFEVDGRGPKSIVCTWQARSVTAEQQAALEAAGVKCDVRILEQVIETLTPEPKYLHRWEPLRFMCASCGTEIEYGDMHNDVAPDGEGGEAFCERVCPACGSWEPFPEPVEIETVRAALARMDREVGDA